MCGHTNAILILICTELCDNGIKDSGTVAGGKIQYSSVGEVLNWCFVVHPVNVVFWFILQK